MLNQNESLAKGVEEDGGNLAITPAAEVRRKDRRGARGREARGKRKVHEGDFV